MPPKRPARKSAPLPLHSRSLRASSANRPDQMDVDTDGDLVASTSVSDRREMEESLKRSTATDVRSPLLVDNRAYEKGLTWFWGEQAGLRKAQKQQHLEEEFEAQAQALEDRINARVEEYRQEHLRSQDGQLARLLDLTHRKANIENEIITHARELADAHDAVKAEFEAVLRGRLEDVSESIGELNALEERASHNS